jgi:hypothetical protein
MAYAPETRVRLPAVRAAAEKRIVRIEVPQSAARNARSVAARVAASTTSKRRGSCDTRCREDRFPATYAAPARASKIPVADVEVPCTSAKSAPA